MHQGTQDPHNQQNQTAQLVADLSVLRSALQAMNGNGSTDQVLAALRDAPESISEALQSENGSLERAVQSLSGDELRDTLAAVRSATQIVESTPIHDPDATGANPRIDHDATGVRPLETDPDATGARSVANDPDATGSVNHVNDLADDTEFTLPERPKSFTDRAALEIEAQGYSNVSVLGAGGLGIVFRATDDMFDRTVAIKIPRPENTAEAFERFRNETLVTGHLGRSRSNVVLAHKAGEIQVDGQELPFLEMEYVEGDTFKELISTLFSGAEHSPAQGYSQKLQAAVRGPYLEACRGVQHLHASTDTHQSIIHRDLKPGNIMVEYEGDDVLQSTGAKIFDLGLAGEVGSFTPGMGRSSRMASGVTMTGDTIGTPKYMSPEQARGETATLDVRSDVYAMGTVLYEMLSGHAPYEGDDIFQMIQQVQDVEHTPAPPRTLNAQAPYELCAIAEKAIHNAPDERYSSISELIADTERYFAGKPVHAVQEQLSGLSKGYYWASTQTARFKKQLAITGLVGALTVGGATGVGSFLESKRAERDYQAKVVAADNTQKTIQDKLEAAFAIQTEKPQEALEEISRAIDIAITQSGPIGRDEFLALKAQGEAHRDDLSHYQSFIEKADNLVSAAIVPSGIGQVDGKTPLSEEIQEMLEASEELSQSENLTDGQLAVVKDLYFKLSLARAMEWAPGTKTTAGDNREEVYSTLYELANNANERSLKSTGEPSLIAVQLAYRAAKELKDAQATEKLAEQLKSLKPKDAFDYAMLSHNAYYGNGEGDKAAFEYAKKGLELDPDHYLCLIYTGTLYAHSNAGDSVPLSLIYLAKAQELKPNSPVAPDRMATVLFNKIANVEIRNKKDINPAELERAYGCLKRVYEITGDELGYHLSVGTWSQLLSYKLIGFGTQEEAERFARKAIESFEQYYRALGIENPDPIEHFDQSVTRYLEAQYNCGIDEWILNNYERLYLHHFDLPEMGSQIITDRFVNLSLALQESFEDGDKFRQKDEALGRYYQILRIGLSTHLYLSRTPGGRLPATGFKYYQDIFKTKLSPEFKSDPVKARALIAAGIYASEGGMDAGKFEEALPLVDRGIEAGFLKQAKYVLETGLQKAVDADAPENICEMYRQRIERISQQTESE